MTDMKPMRLSRVMTCWNLEGEVEQVPDATHLMKYVYETLETHAPEDAEPYCCYLCTVIFYERTNPEIRGLGPREITRCDHYDLATAPSPHLVYFGGLWYEISPNRVLWRNGEWQERYVLDARSRHARLLNLGGKALLEEYAR